MLGIGAEVRHAAEVKPAWRRRECGSRVGLCTPKTRLNTLKPLHARTRRDTKELEACMDRATDTDHMIGGWLPGC
jgi:hypothetical protein